MAQKVSNAMADTLMLVGGGVVGAGLALLFAPCSGTKSRKRMVHLGKSMSKKSDRALRNFTDSMTDLADTVSGKASGIMHKW